eukprot:3622702-Pyramimonas_sp.AAC.1
MDCVPIAACEPRPFGDDALTRAPAKVEVFLAQLESRHFHAQQCYGAEDGGGQHQRAQIHCDSGC